MTPYKVGIGLSLGIIAYNLYWFYSFHSEIKFQEYLQFLRKKIRKNWKNNPNIEKLDIVCENTLPLKDYNDILFFVKVIASAKFAIPKSERPVISDPFDKNVCEKISIDTLSSTHSLLYNKFPLVPFHVLVVTKEFEPQMSLVNKNDFYAALKVMKALDCFVFFNGGPDAGASQKHKHLQAIPYNSFPNHTIPLNALIEKTKESDKFENGILYSQIVPFKFKHILCRFEKNLLLDLNNSNINKKAKLLESVYIECLRRLDNLDLHIAYNFILAKHWLFMVLRKCEVAMKMIKINAVGFTGSFAVRSDKEYEFLRSQDPLNILAAVTFPLS